MNAYYQDGQVYRRGKRVKKWKGRLRIYGHDGSVKRTEVTLGLCTKISKSEARANLRQMILQSGSHPSPLLADTTFGDYWHNHYVPLRRSGWSEPTEAGYKAYMKSFVLPTFEHLSLKDIDHIFLSNYFADLKERCGYWTMKKVRMLLKSIFEEALNDGLTPKNPMRRLPLPNTADPDRPVLAKPDAAKALDTMKKSTTRTGIRDYVITRIGTFCAVRSSEVFGLLWECDLGDSLFIKHSAWEGRIFARHTKKAKPRKVAIDNRTRQALNRWKKICGHPAPGSLMFPSAKAGVPLTSRNWLKRNLQPVGRNLGIKTPLTFQVLRRSFATHNQKHLKNVQAHLGHESTGTTADLYVVEIPEEVRRTQERYAAEIDALGKAGKRKRRKKKSKAALRVTPLGKNYP